MKQKTLLGAGGLLSLLIIWQLSSYWLSQRISLASTLAPLPTLDSFIWLISSGEIFPHLFASLQRIFVGLSFSLIVGVPIGLLLGFFKKLEIWCTPAFQLLRMISPLSWMPIIVMLLAFASVWSLIISTSAGVKSIDPQWLLLARSLSASKQETLCKIVFPAIVGHVLTGLRVSMGIAWVILVPCEMLGVNEGLGYFILDTRDRLAYSELMAVVVIIGLIGWGLDSLIRWALVKGGK
ncbi:ABC transporter permease subunit [Haemophilus parahaemolyticus]|uniref:ABC transporter permease n=1 Tax=Haemophilus parahaemolyticus TaxID=735 RepID=UPI00290FA993|nr:ABC transporter permease subunit [Haemophilus parahaemolyticus]MDU4464330.1 ABC transporter permease subunit [Haemophilus parahaemolyticus]